MPRARDYTAKYFNLSYFNPSTGKFGLGWADGHLILFCIVLLTGLRAATMEYILAPFAKSQGLSKRKDITRFSEQAWMSVYYAIFWPFGLVGFLPHNAWARPVTTTANTTNNSTFTTNRLRTSTCTSCGPAGQTGS